MFYVFSILYFFIIYRPSDRIYVAIGYMFSILNAGMIAAGVWGWIAHGKSSCATSGGYGAIVVINSLVGCLVGIAVLVLHTLFYIKFRATGKIPFLNP